MTSTDLLIAASALVAVTVLAFTLLTGWRGWLAFKGRELELRCAGPHHPGPEPERGPERTWGEGAARIELADLKERIRRLEAIANGVDL